MESEAEIPQLGEAIAALAQDFEMPPDIEKQLLPGPPIRQAVGV